MANEDLIGDVRPKQQVLEPSDELSLREETFCAVYITNGENGTQAALAAGVPQGSAAWWASQALKKPKIQAEIERLLEPVREQHGLTLERVLKEIKAVATFDKRKLYDKDGRRKAIVELDDETAAALSHFGANDVVPFDKLKAIDMAMKHLGGYEKDNTQRAENLKINIMLVDK